MAYLDKEVSTKSPFQPLIPSIFNTEKYQGGVLGTFSFGGTADRSVWDWIV